MLRRRPAVAGLFYEFSPKSLKEQIEECFLHPIGPGKIPEKAVVKGSCPLALISPHAGYMYSGPVVAHGYFLLAGRMKPDTIIIVGPNHYGIGVDASIYPSGVWVTPLGEVEVDYELAKYLAESWSIFSLDEFSHSREHSIEVQIPFLQYILGDTFKILPICMLDQSLETALQVGESLAELIREKKNRSIMLIASTDFTHYEPHSVAVKKDFVAIEKITRLDCEELYRVIRELDISMCGYGPVISIMEASRRLGAREAQLLKYATSGDVTGDKTSVVGYASIKIEHPLKI
ncbi:MAG: AmmeMemoRadiSam system protein B [Nitrososphaerota archaeon]